MEAKDLMIGDYVFSKCGGNNEKVCYITDEGIWLRFDERYSEVVNERDIEPIPLTAEILKDNGIELFAVGDNGVATPPKWRNRLEQWLIHTKWKDTNLWYDRMTKKYRLQDTNAIEIEYVHQLQQTLRLAKIEKEIVI